MTDHNFAPDDVYISVEDQPDRNQIVLLLDISLSMKETETPGGPPKIDQLKEVLDEFLTTGMHQDQTKPDKVNMLRINGEIAIAVFGNKKVAWLHLADQPVADNSPFYYVQQVHGLTPEARSALVPNGDTPMAEAVEKALDEIEIRKDQLQALGLTHECRPNVFLLTDGQASTSVDTVARRIATEEDNEQVLFWAFGTQGCDRRTLFKLASEEGCHFLGVNSMASYLEFLNRSMRHQAGAKPGQSAADIKQQMHDRVDDETDFNK